MTKIECPQIWKENYIREIIRKKKNRNMVILHDPLSWPSDQVCQVLSVQVRHYLFIQGGHNSEQNTIRGDNSMCHKSTAWSNVPKI